jgi:outer membrane receptor for ferric coprogen and ferric-rhodotorulic acid
MRTETRLIETPQSVQIIGKDLMQDQQAKNLSEAAENVAGVSRHLDGMMVQ